MESEKSAAAAIVVTFDSAEAASRRIAGVAAAARVARAAIDRGAGEIRLVVPGGRLRRAAQADLDRIAGAVPVRLAEPGEGPGSPDSIAPVLSASAILRATGKAGDGPVSRWLNRPVSRAISRLLLLLPFIRPIHATIGTALIAAIMVVVLVFGGPAGLLAGALLFQAASIFDGVDGEIARATFRTSRLGAAIDSVVDFVTNIGFIIGVIVNLAGQGAPYAVLVGGWGLALFVLGLGAVGWRSARGDQAFGFDLVKHAYAVRAPGTWLALLIRLATIVSGRDFFALLFAVLILAGQPMAVLYLFAAAATIWIMTVAGAVSMRNRSAPAERSA